MTEKTEVEWNHLVLQVAAAAEEFNQTVQHYNDAVRQFPAVLLAWLFGFKPGRGLRSHQA